MGKKVHDEEFAMQGKKKKGRIELLSVLRDAVENCLHYINPGLRFLSVLWVFPTFKLGPSFHCICSWA